jgi:hypothetical protein
VPYCTNDSGKEGTTSNCDDRRYRDPSVARRVEKAQLICADPDGAEPSNPEMTENSSKVSVTENGEPSATQQKPSNPRRHRVDAKWAIG